MSKARQVFDFDSSEYERPNHPWICGRACEGTACALGPSAGGQCGVVCEPYREGDRYYCNNVSLISSRCDEGPDADGNCCHLPAQCVPAKKAGTWGCTRGQCMVGPLADGQCSQHQNVCRPRRSVWSQRRVLTLTTISLVMGGLLALLAGPSREAVVSPGALTSAHAASSCKACHLAGAGTLSDWVHRALSGGPASERSDQQSEQKCLACHGDLGAEPLNAHGLRRTHLVGLTKRAAAREAAGSQVLIETAQMIFGRPHQGVEKLACGTCHQEHRGRGHDLTGISNEQCQSCHQNTFHSLEHGHPEFSDYPYQRRTRIYFDHVTHYNQHFDSFTRIMPGGKKPASCLTCHTLDTAGRKMLVLGFDETCSSCHSSQIKDALIEGITIVAVPGIDPVALADEQLPLGVWPKHPLNQDGFGPQGEMPAVMTLLLLADQGYLQRRDSLADVDLLELSDMTPEQAEAVASLAAATKQVLREIATGDQARLQKRLNATVGRLAPSAVVQQMVELLLEARQSAGFAEAIWFPELSGELDDAEVVVQDFYKPQVVSESSSDERIGWSTVSSDLTVRYSALGHADLTMKRWLETVIDIRNAAADLPAGEQPDVQQAIGRLFAAVTSPIASGRCVKCHSIDRSGDHVVINWLSTRDDSAIRSFTHFAHSPHMREIAQDACNACHATEGEECMQCHTVKKQSGRYRPEFFDRDWAPVRGSGHFSSDFSDLPTSNCATCHNNSVSRSDCLTCHKYHVRQASVQPAANIDRVELSDSPQIDVHELP